MWSGASLPGFPGKRASCRQKNPRPNKNGDSRPFSVNMTASLFLQRKHRRASKKSSLLRFACGRGDIPLSPCPLSATGDALEALAGNSEAKRNRSSEAGSTQGRRDDLLPGAKRRSQRIKKGTGGRSSSPCWPRHLG